MRIEKYIELSLDLKLFEILEKKTQYFRDENKTFCRFLQKRKKNVELFAYQ